MRALALFAACCALGAAATSAASAPTVARCRAGQLKLTGSLQGATQSLLGTLDLVNTGRACALPASPSRVTVRVGTKLLRTVTVAMNRQLWPTGVPTRKLQARERAYIGIQWRNWCGSPRGKVRVSIGVKIYSNVAPRTPGIRARTPQCINPKRASTVAVSRFIGIPK
jgi:hypothetical protein